MTKENRTIIAVITLILTALILFFIFYKNTDEKKYDWTENYHTEDEPFHVSVLQNLLSSYFEGYDYKEIDYTIFDALQDTSTTHKTYVFVGKELVMADSVAMALEKFVHNGNDAFISAEILPQLIAETILQDTAYYAFIDNIQQYVDENYTGESYEQTDSNSNIVAIDSVLQYDSMYAEDTTLKLDSLIKWFKNYYTGDTKYSLIDTDYYCHFINSTIALNFINPDFKSAENYQYTFKVRDSCPEYEWLFFKNNVLQKVNDLIALGNVADTGINYIEFQYGKGKFFIHTTPLLFTNFYMLTEKNLDYTSKVLSYLTPGDIIWDEYSKTPHSDFSFNDYSNSESAGPLQFIVSQKELRWSWYILLAGLLLFMIFRSKRLQQIIPIIEPNINKSLEFMQTIGRMYYMRNDSKQLVMQKMKLFLIFIKDRYQLNTVSISDDFINKLELKSQILAEDIQAIFTAYDTLEKQHTVSDKALISFHQRIDYFYKNCK